MTEQEIKMPKPKDVMASMSVADQFVAYLIKQQVDKVTDDTLKDEIFQHARDFIREEYGTVEKKVKVIRDDGKEILIKGVIHEKFDEVLAFVREKEPVFLCGGAGTGKNVICSQVAQALGLDFYFSNAVTQEYKITGFTDAMGRYQESQFYKAFKNGGLFMLDEMDASCPEALVVLNAAIANGYFDFPAPIGRIDAHEDFRVVGAGNTYGHGASYQYVGRNQLDGATLDRFAVVRVDYSPKIEEAMAMGNDELLDFVRKFRKACAEAGINSIVSYRSIKRMAKMETYLGAEETIRSGLTKNLEKGDIDMLLKKMGTSGKYCIALKKVQECAD